MLNILGTQTYYGTNNYQNADVVISGVGAFFLRQDAGLLPAGSINGNYPTIYCLPHTTTVVPRTNSVFCLTRRH
jgi:hypothetical protein